MTTQEAILTASQNKHFRTIIDDMAKREESGIMDFSIKDEVFYVYRENGVWNSGKYGKKKAESILTRGYLVKII